jgi:hypothetical protein
VHHSSFGLAFRYKLPFVVPVGYGVGNLSPQRVTNRSVYFLTKVLTVLHEKWIFFVCVIRTIVPLILIYVCLFIDFCAADAHSCVTRKLDCLHTLSELSMLLRCHKSMRIVLNFYFCILLAGNFLCLGAFEQLL